MLFANLFRRPDPTDGIALALYRAVVDKARDPAFYTDLAVPDTVNGRFDMVVIHAMLVVRRLRGGGVLADQTAKALLELLFRDMDSSLREMGVGDMGISRHIKRMAKAFFGRAEAYEAGLDGDPGALSTILKENLYRHDSPRDDQVTAMSEYMRRAASHIAQENLDEILAGRVSLAVRVLP
jgi:cytochrome b pre-mRNA-processing protein 3